MSLKTKIIIGAIVIAGAGIAYAAVHNSNNPATNANSAGQSSTQTGTSDKSTPGANNSNSGQSGSQSSYTGAKPVTPSGQFVSNHNPTLSGDPGPDEYSTCTTSVGATCQITFTMGSVTKNLPVKTVDQSGSTNWSWKLPDYGITTGTWTITVTASNASGSVSVTDQIKLKVSS